MHSSISSSETPTKAHVATLLCLCLVLCLAVEVITVRLFPVVSKMERRHESEYRSALFVQSGKPRGTTSVLIAGNSLLLHGVEYPQLQQAMGSNVELRRVAIENTFYFDWYYGLRRIFHAGARPDVVVLVLNPAQLTSDAIDGDYSVHMMVDGRDLPDLGRNIGADRNRMSVLALDKMSFFFGDRAQIRSLILGRILPDLPKLTQSFHFTATVPAAEVVNQRAALRLSRLRQLCADHGVSLVLVLPPAMQDTGANPVLQAAVSEHVPVLMPLAPGALPESDYSDAFHLNSLGVVKFTSLLADGLKNVMQHPAVQANGAMTPPDAIQGRSRVTLAIPAAATVETVH
jgi:hypothetical protein